jgi:hypothetical protein
MKIIGDIHIWYNLAEGQYDENKIKSLPLCLTAWNVIELISSPKLKMPLEKQKVINTAKEIRKINPNYIPYEPYSFMATEFMGISNNNVLELKVIDDLIENKLTDSDIDKFIQFRNERVQGFKASMDKQQKE